MICALSQYINFPLIYKLLMSLYVISIVTIIGVILSENRNPVKSLAWVTVLVLLPGAGIVLYLFFGRNIKNKHRVSRRLRRQLRRQERRYDVDLRRFGLSEASMQQIGLGRSLCGAMFYPGNDVKVYSNGADKFRDLLADLAAAREYIELQYYIFEDDRIGRRVRDVLAERAAAGVDVRVIYDHVGSFNISSRFFKDMRRAGINAHPFFKVSFPQFGTRINWRNHRKLVVIDGRIGYLGGMNIADRYLDGGKFQTWRDTHVRVTGPIVRALHYSFTFDWHFMGHPEVPERIIPAEHPAELKVGAQMLISGPTSQWSAIANLFQKAISNARRRIYIQTPYFLPTEALLRALQNASLAHVDVRVMIPLKSDSLMLTLASASYIAECMRAGIKFYRYKAGMLHSKMLLVDDEFVSIGSTNFDFRSFEHNFEANLFFYSKALNEQMAAQFAADQAQSERISSAQWRRRPLWQKVAESILRLLSPVL